MRLTLTIPWVQIRADMVHPGTTTPQEMIAETETGTTTEVATEDGRGLPGIEIQDAASLM